MVYRLQIIHTVKETKVLNTQVNVVAPFQALHTEGRF